MLLTFSAVNSERSIGIESRLANRHGLVAGATGTGKTVTLQAMAQAFSDAGVPVFLADVKGDLAGISQPGTALPRTMERLVSLGRDEPAWAGTPTIFWDVFGKLGHPMRATISDLGPSLLGRLMDLNETQASVLQVIFKIADDAGLLVIDLKDLDALLRLVSENLPRFKEQYGHLSPASVGTIQRSLLTLRERGGEVVFGEPALDIADLLQVDARGKGYVHVLAAQSLFATPVVYSTLLLWMLSELFEALPEVGDLDRPKLVFFFDEAHLLFKDTSKVLLEQVEQVVRLIRSKGVGIYFVTQNPLDLPESVLGQLSHRVQHALRAFTPKDQKAVKAAAETMRPNPLFDAAKAVTELQVGEALVSVLDPTGAPTTVERAWIIPPSSRLGPVTDSERAIVRAASPLGAHYEQAIDRDSAFEVLGRASRPAATAVAPTSESLPSERPAVPSKPSVLSEILLGSTGPRGGHRAGILEKAATSAARSVATSVGRELMRGLMGSLLGGSGGSRRRR